MTEAAAETPAARAVLAQARSENFPVASRLFPREVRPHLMRVYAFARLVDDIGDEASGDRLTLLDSVSSDLDAIEAGRTPTHPLLQRLASTVRDRGLPRGPFDRLIEANRQDQVVSRYRTFEDLRAYCALSANPVGELVLRICRGWTPEHARLSDDVCTGLQLVEFWQDLGEDASMGRVYVPLEDLERFGYGIEELLAGATGQPFVRLMRFESERTRRLLASGRALARSVSGRVGLALRLFGAGGVAALQDLERRRFDTFHANAHASRARRASVAARELVRR